MTPFFIRATFVLALTFLSVPVVFAADSGGIQGGQQDSGGVQSGSGTTLINPLNLGVDCTTNHTCINIFIQKLLQLVVDVGTVIVILMLVYVGFLFVKARGEPGAITEARQALMWTVIGGLILLGAEGIAQAIAKTVGSITAAGS